MNYELLTGPFAGSIVEEGQQILDVDWEELDEDMQSRIETWAEQENIKIDDHTDMNLIKQSYENSWDSEETDQETDLKSVSEW